MTAIRPAIRSAIQPAIRSAFAGSYGWLPTSLFAAGEQGVWYDPSDLSTMFQDVAGTVPVTADGQLVARINDKSGRGNHATQATEASRPLYKTSGGLHWLQFDGTDDFLRTAAIDFSARDEMSVFTGMRKSSDAARGALLTHNGTNTNAFSVEAPSASLNNIHLSAGGDTLVRTPIYLVAAPTTQAISGLIDLSAPYVTLRTNGVQRASNTGTFGGGNFVSAPLYLGRRGGTDIPLNGNIYSFIARGKASSAEEIAQAEAFVAGKTGVTLP